MNQPKPETFELIDWLQVLSSELKGDPDVDENDWLMAFQAAQAIADLQVENERMRAALTHIQNGCGGAFRARKLARAALKGEE